MMTARPQDVALLPLPKYPTDGAGDEDSYNTGWNECLDSCAAALASAQAREEALRGIAERWDEAAAYARSNGDITDAENMEEAAREARVALSTNAAQQPIWVDSRPLDKLKAGTRAVTATLYAYKPAHRYGRKSVRLIPLDAAGSAEGVEGG